MDISEDRIERTTIPSGDESQRSGWGVILGDLNNLGVDVVGAGLIAGGGMIASKLHSHQEPSAPAEASQPEVSDPEPQA
jgi:hypothetical protein